MKKVISIMVFLLVGITVSAISWPPKKYLLVSWNYSTNEVVDAFPTFLSRGASEKWEPWHVIYPTNINILHGTNYSALLPISSLEKGTFSFVMFAKLTDLWSKPSEVKTFQVNELNNPDDLLPLVPFSIQLVDKNDILKAWHPLAVSIETKTNKLYLLKYSLDGTNWSNLEMIEGGGTIWHKDYDPHPDTMPFLELIELEN